MLHFHLPHTPVMLTERQGFLVGIGILVIANICFSAKAILVKLLYLEGMTTESIIAMRMLFSLPVFVGVALYLHARTINVRLSFWDWLVISGLGILSYYVSSMLDFKGLQYVTAGVERMVLFTYPTIVVLLSSVLLDKPITKRQVAALILTYLGVALIFYAETATGDQKDLWKGGAFVFCCAITYSFYVIYTGQYAQKVGSMKFTAYALMAATVPTVLQSWWVEGLQIGGFSDEVYMYGVTLAIVATVVPTFLITEGIRSVGANTSSIVGFIGPISTIFLAWWWLGEPISALQLVGTAVVLVGIYWLTRK